MQPLNSLASLLHQLITTGGVVRSKISTRSRNELAKLYDLGALREERRGAGWVVVVANQDSVRRFADRQFPSGLFGEGDTSEGRRTQSLIVLAILKPYQDLISNSCCYVHLAMPK